MLVSFSLRWRNSVQIDAIPPRSFAVSDLIPLARAHCIPRRGHEHRLPPAQIAELMPQLPGWALAENDHALVKTFAFPDY